MASRGKEDQIRIVGFPDLATFWLHAETGALENSSSFGLLQRELNIWVWAVKPKPGLTPSLPDIIGPTFF